MLLLFCPRFHSTSTTFQHQKYTTSSHRWGNKCLSLFVLQLNVNVCLRSEKCQELSFEWPQFCISSKPSLQLVVQQMLCSKLGLFLCAYYLPPHATEFHVVQSRNAVCFPPHENLLRAEMVILAKIKRNFSATFPEWQVLHPFLGLQIICENV